MFLASTSDLLQVITDAAADIEVHASWVDKVAATEPVAGRTNTDHITTATTTTVVGSPAASTVRNVKFVSFHNNHATQSCLLRVVHTDGTTAEELMHTTLLSGDALILNRDGEWIHYNNNGAQYANTLPYQDSGVSISGVLAETLPRNVITETNTAALTSGTLHMVGVYLRRGQIVNSISFFSATTASGTPTNGFFGLYSSALSKLAETANFTTEAWAANTIKTKSVTTPYTVITSGFYYLAIMLTATTVPTLKGGTTKTASQLAGTAPILHGNSTAGLTTSIPATAGAITVSTTNIWGAVG